MTQFILNDTAITTNVNTGITLLDFIREHQHLKGTKIGCREGDCGACTVLVGTLAADNTVQYQSITSCISPLGNAHGKHIVSIEGINIPKSLTFPQQAMANNYATQCGFCTPGFVVSMTGFALQQNNTSNCNDAISGNICRCTGYKSIEKAGFKIEDKLRHKDQNHQIDWLISNAFIPNYFKEIPNKLKAIPAQKLSTKGTKVANGTDLFVRFADQMATKEMHLLFHNTALDGITFKEKTCIIGANTTVTQMAENRKLNTLFPKLQQFLKLISSEQIRNMGTLGGNFVNASPIGDMSIFFLALNAKITIIDSEEKEREIPFQQFHIDYKKYDLKTNEIIKSISFPIQTKHTHFNFEKVCKRTHLDIASVNAAARITFQNNLIIDAHFSLGGVAAVPKYLTQTNDFILGKELTVATIKAAEEVLQSEISPISDVRGTIAYKRLLARQLFFAHFITLFPTKFQLQNLIPK
jgi:xanthine dehydrogenase small subunit